MICDVHIKLRFIGEHPAAIFEDDLLGFSRHGELSSGEAADFAVGAAGG